MIDQETFVSELIAGSVRNEAYQYILKCLLLKRPNDLAMKDLKELEAFAGLFQKMSESEQNLLKRVLRFAIEETIQEFLELIDRGRDRLLDEKASLKLTWVAVDGSETILAGDEGNSLTFLGDLFGAERRDNWVLK